MCVFYKRNEHTSICTDYTRAFISQVKQPDDVSFVTLMIYFPLLVAEFLLSCIADIRYRTPPSVDKKEERVSFCF